MKWDISYIIIAGGEKAIYVACVGIRVCCWSLGFTLRNVRRSFFPLSLLRCYYLKIALPSGHDHRADENKGFPHHSTGNAPSPLLDERENQVPMKAPLTLPSMVPSFHPSERPQQSLSPLPSLDSIRQSFLSRPRARPSTRAFLKKDGYGLFRLESRKLQSRSSTAAESR